MLGGDTVAEWIESKGFWSQAAWDAYWGQYGREILKNYCNTNERRNMETKIKSNVAAAKRASQPSVNINVPLYDLHLDRIAPGRYNIEAVCGYLTNVFEEGFDNWRPLDQGNTPIVFFEEAGAGNVFDKRALLKKRTSITLAGVMYMLYVAEHHQQGTASDPGAEYAILNLPVRAELSVTKNMLVEEIFSQFWEGPFPSVRAVRLAS